MTELHRKLMKLDWNFSVEQAFSRYFKAEPALFVSHSLPLSLSLSLFTLLQIKGYTLINRNMLYTSTAYSRCYLQISVLVIRGYDGIRLLPTPKNDS